MQLTLVGVLPLVLYNKECETTQMKWKKRGSEQLMQKTVTAFLLAFICSLLLVVPAAAESPVTVNLNGQPVSWSPRPEIADGLTMVPLLPLGEALGAKTEWIPSRQAASIDLPGVHMEITAHSSAAMVNGEKISLPVAPVIKDGEIVVPLRAVAEVLKIPVQWDSTTWTVHLHSGAARDTVHQISLLSSLLEGHYDGLTTFRELKNYGDTGIGTFAALDGEMIALDGQFFQVKADGIAYSVTEEMSTPFACVTYFEADQAADIVEPVDFSQFQAYVDNMISNKNLFYAIKATGSFSHVQTRSVPAQQKPYPPLVDVTKNQPTFDLENLNGTLIGFWCPAYVDGLNVPGYHIHFLNADKNRGGHLLDFTMESGRIEIDVTPNFFMRLPDSDEFGQIDMRKDRAEETSAVEK